MPGRYPCLVPEFAAGFGPWFPLGQPAVSLGTKAGDGAVAAARRVWE